MPIYEFRCLKCNHIFELLRLSSDESVDMECPKCTSADFERVMSSTHYAMASGAAAGSGPRAENRQCSSGNCSTFEIPGP